LKSVAGRRGVVIGNGFYDKREKLSVQAGKGDKILDAYAKHMTQ